MTLLSRALWNSTDDGATIQERVLDRVRDWIWESDEPQVADGSYSRTIRRQVDGTTVEGTRAIAVRRSSEPPGVRIQVDDQLKDTVWGVVITVGAEQGRVEFAVDNTVETSDPALRVSAGRPRVIDSLLGIGEHPRQGASAIQTSPIEFTGTNVVALAEHLLDQDRALPVVALTCSRAGFTADTIRAADQLARRLTGLGVVTLLDPDAQDALKRVMPAGLGVWGGAVRVYGLGPLVSADAWRHRFFTADRFPRAADQIIAWAIAITARRRMPDLLRAVERATTDTSDVPALQRRIKQLESLLEETELDLAVEQEERASLDQQLNQALGHNARMRSAGFELGRGGEVFTLESAPPDEAPDDAQSVGDAFLQAQIYLGDALALPDSAARDHERLDSSPNAGAWGNSTWRGLLSLAAYARAKKSGNHSGNFWAWCERGTSSWPASSKKLAMSESETTSNNRRYTAARVFPVDPALDPSGERYMEAHLKISEGGGNLAPRVYFFDDTDGATRAVHIGFVGPHDLVPNSKA